MPSQLFRQLLLACFALALMPAPVGANDGGGGNEMLMSPVSPLKARKRGDCAGLPALKRDLDKAQARVQSERSALAEYRSLLDKAKKGRGGATSNRLNVATYADDVKETTASLAAAIKLRDGLKKAYDKIAENCD